MYKTHKQTLLSKDTQMSQEHMKRYLSLVAIKEKQIKTMRRYYILIKTTNMKNSDNTKY